jgi:virulence-associated protein VapD
LITLINGSYSDGSINTGTDSWRTGYETHNAYQKTYDEVQRQMTAERRVADQSSAYMDAFGTEDQTVMTTDPNTTLMTSRKRKKKVYQDDYVGSWLGAINARGGQLGALV